MTLVVGAVQSVVSVAEWYENKSIDALAYQAVKYRQRNGWTHRDLFRLAHPQGVDQGVGNFILGKDVEAEVEILKGFAQMQSATSVKDVIRTLETFKNLPLGKDHPNSVPQGREGVEDSLLQRSAQGPGSHS